MQQTIALSTIHNVSNASHHVDDDTAVLPLVATTHPLPYTFMSLERGIGEGMNPQSSRNPS